MSLTEKEKNNGQNEQYLASSYIESPDVGYTTLTRFVNFPFFIQIIFFINALLQAGKRVPLALLRRVRW
jgi:hypothetical protein